MAHGRYTIVGKLADGGMAEIFLAMQHGAEGFQKPVVVKRILTAFSADPQFRNMFLDEAHISMSLRHGNIVQVLDVGVAGERAFLVLELIEGWDLQQLLARAQATGPEHPWPPSLALYVTAQICRGLAYAHAKKSPDGQGLGIVHRDVSPNNVLISEQGEVKLADFGIAKAERKREQTLAGVIKGKIGFMSPEQALGRPLDARADLFSLGTVMYLMLTGRRPFQAGSELESMMLAQRAEYRPPEELNPYLSPEATEIVRKAMARDPGQRYQTADEMLIDVERVLRGQYHSAGQTELKVWLAELARRDGLAPMGRIGVDDNARPTLVDEAGELSAGTWLELSDGEQTAAAAQATTRAAALSPSTPVALMSSEAPPSPAGPSRSVPGAVTPTLPPSKPRATRRSRVGLGFVLGALCMLGTVFGIRWLAHWAGRERLGLPSWVSLSNDAAVTDDRAVSVPVPSGASAPAEAAANTAVPAAEPNTAGPRPDAASVPPASSTAAGTSTEPSREGSTRAVRAASQDSASADGAVAPVAAESDDEEARLLGRLLPDAAAVVGEDEAEEASGKAARADARKTSVETGPPGGPAKEIGRSGAHTRVAAEAGKAATPAAAVSRAKPVQIRITTSPLGAVVRTKKQVLGRTPLAVRFKPGNTYELTFVKSGYVTNSRRLLVVAGKPKSISVAMKKKAAQPARHGFFRGR